MSDEQQTRVSPHNTTAEQGWPATARAPGEEGLL
jgi:hypothetical protein